MNAIMKKSIGTNYLKLYVIGCGRARPVAGCVGSEDREVVWRE